MSDRGRPLDCIQFSHEEMCAGGVDGKCKIHEKQDPVIVQLTSDIKKKTMEMPQTAIASSPAEVVE